MTVGDVFSLLHQSRLLSTGVLLFFFFQAEDGIRDIGVTGVQTCALPILVALRRPENLWPGSRESNANLSQPRLFDGAHARRDADYELPGPPVSARAAPERSEERRVGKECRSRWSPYH